MNIILLGAPGSGKGTQAISLAEDQKLLHISTGELLRAEVAKKSDIGIEAKSYLDSGSLVPDSLVVGMIKNRISEKDADNGFILDGFPRNLAQAEMLEKMLSELNKKIDFVINFEIDEAVLLKRISGRFSCSDCGEVYNKFFKPTKLENICDKCGSDKFSFRSDDNEETLKSRLKVYREFALGLNEFYKKNNLLISIDALKSSSQIFEDLKKIVSN